MIRTFLLLSSLFLISCSSIERQRITKQIEKYEEQNPKKRSKGKPQLARITYYCASEDGKWKNRVSDQKVKYARYGTTVAACPSVPFGTKVVIPKLRGIIDDGQFVVQDRGSAVTSKKASGGKLPVIDVYVRSREEMRNLARKLPRYMEILIN